MFALVLAAAALAQDPVDLNSATAEQLEELPGIGPAKAQAILVWRAQIGRCTDPADVADVPGIGAATWAAIRDRVTCDEPGDASPERPAPGGLAPEARPGEVDINRADVAQLLALPGMVRSRAEAIVADRERNGPFASCSELVRVDGIGPATVANLGSRCVAR